MPKATTKVSISDFAVALTLETRKALRLAARRIANRGVEIMREEVPRRSGKLAEGVKGTVSRTNPPEVTIIASAVAQRLLGTATVVSPSGKTKRVSLRGGGSFNYAQAVQEGTGLFGPRGQLIRPKRAKAMLISVDSPPPDESYLVFGGRYFIFRQSSQGMKPNDYIGRTVIRITPEAAQIISEELGRVASKQL